MKGYRAEDWNVQQVIKNFKLPLRSDFKFRLIRSPPMYFDTVVATSLPVYLTDASCLGPDHKCKLTILAGAFKRLGARVHLCPKGVMNKIIEYNRKYLYPEFETVSSGDILTVEAWVAQINHPDKKKESFLKPGIF
jgi:hypothetical protein